MERRKPCGKGFTLIELLVVVGIIGLLVAILLPAVNKMMQKSETATAKMDLGRIVTAWESYYREYGRWPVGANGMLFAPYGSAALQQNATENISPGMRMLVGVMTNLMYPNSEFDAGGGSGNMNHNPACTNFNAKRLQFLEYHAKSVNAQGDFVDPWNNVYWFMFDLNRDGRIVRGGTMATTVYAKVIAWSLGPDGVLSSDDIKSWE